MGGGKTQGIGESTRADSVRFVWRSNPRRMGSCGGGDPLGQLPFFIEFLNVSGVFDAWAVDCPLAYTSNNAAEKRAVLATLLLSILAGHHRYTHIAAMRNDRIRFCRNKRTEGIIAE